MNLAPGENSTNVRFMGGIAICFALTSCATPPLARSDGCGVDTSAVCTTFGPTRSCGCVPRTEVDRLLATFGEPAWLGGTH